MALSFKSLSIAACAAFVAAGAQAAAFQNDTGLTAPTTIETFDGSTFAEGTGAGSLFNGVSFSSNLVVTTMVTTMLDGAVPSFSGQTLANFSADAPLGEITFATAVRGAAFSLLMYPGDAQFSAYLGQQLVEQATLPVDYAGRYVGFTGITFDRIVFGSETNRTGMAIDNLQITAVPEPGTTLLMTLGLIGIGLAARRRARNT